jgi:ribonuclease HII
MTEKISTLQQALDVVEELDPEEQAILVDIISKRLSQQRRNELLKEVAQARSDYQQGNIKQGSVADLMAELDE